MFPIWIIRAFYCVRLAIVRYSVKFELFFSFYRATEKHNVEYCVALVEEADRIKESFLMRTTDFVAAAVSLQTLGERLRKSPSINLNQIRL